MYIDVYMHVCVCLLCVSVCVCVYIHTLLPLPLTAFDTSQNRRLYEASTLCTHVPDSDQSKCARKQKKEILGSQCP
jgi:hypothetical protein